MPTIMQSVKYDDQHLQDLAHKARARGSTKRGYLMKADPKQKKLHARWCCVYQNFFFYFESESCTRPLGMIFLEGTLCKEVPSVAGQKEVSKNCRSVRAAMRFIALFSLRRAPCREASKCTLKTKRPSSTTSAQTRRRRERNGWTPSPMQSERCLLLPGAVYTWECEVLCE